MYDEEILHPEDDNGTMPYNVQGIREEVVGHKIVHAGYEFSVSQWGYNEQVFAITLDNGKKVVLRDTDDCCAYTELKAFLLHAGRVDHVITGVGTTGEYTKWHIFADMGDVLELTVGWSSGNPFYYGYGFDIEVRDAPEAPSV